MLRDALGRPYARIARDPKVVSPSWNGLLASDRVRLARQELDILPAELHAVQVEPDDRLRGGLDREERPSQLCLSVNGDDARCDQVQQCDGRMDGPALLHDRARDEGRVTLLRGGDY